MSRDAAKPSIRLSVSAPGLKPITALTACAALTALATPGAAHPQQTPALLEVEAPVPPPHIQPANANERK